MLVQILVNSAWCIVVDFTVYFLNFKVIFNISLCARSILQDTYVCHLLQKIKRKIDK